MDVSQLPDITGLLVRPDNPPRDDVEGMDYPRCAALYNYLAQYSWLAEGRPLATLNENSTNFFTAFGAEAEALRPRLDPSLVAFLDTAMIPPSDNPDQFPPPLSIFAWGLPTPDGLIEEFVADLQDQPVDSLVRLSPVGLSGEGSGGGVIYHQRFHRVAVFMHLDSYDYGFPVEDHPDIWNPLETVLSHWINLIQLGKVVASPHEEPALFDFEKIGPWEWRPYSEAQVTTCVGAWDRLCRAIEARISQLPNPLSLIGPISRIDTDNPEPLVASTVLNAALVPDPSFARSFLTRARRPRFHYIAPGLLLPPADSSRFIAAQPFTVLPHSQHTAPPVCLFPAEGGDQRPIQLTRTTTPFLLLDYYSISTDTLTPSRVSAGLYTAAVERNGLDTAEDGFRLLLPFTLNDGWGRSVGARRSDGELTDRGSFADLFQHGFKPFGGDYYRPQRLERLLDCWRKLVEDGVWSIGPKGVEGTIDTFKDAESDRWEDYYIPPTW
ncbi:hypothetical protein N7517_000878 [Penicillium concentricum]|uniref:Uncharacterized protein n=1 Tax=Penicillium concentricum TaxID=293559 RepID=A0A9W9SR26_9EURO|nr:uncharacterized protein N7517_000878 [Penicillium concentricum]KAJ5382967.1 hypothetical protein N7517_000878 [Penicillium concentricum]